MFFYVAPIYQGTTESGIPYVEPGKIEGGEIVSAGPLSARARVRYDHVQGQCTITSELELGDGYIATTQAAAEAVIPDVATIRKPLGKSKKPPGGEVTPWRS